MTSDLVSDHLLSARNDALPVIVSSASIPTIPVLSDFNTGINTAQICGGIPVFGIPVLEALLMVVTWGSDNTWLRLRCRTGLGLQLYRTLLLAILGLDSGGRLDATPWVKNTG